ncbi:hypothetical protein KGA66_27845 [Actinocrinis puniceicyclus]|uniref:Uncharacterized protein n=1 Tax=Actinocrinis puniceicyclus TaxID=977794 RepID=A0A8J8BEY6_9ACTN|nr:hypothetical protein [Actinocrinis puniceicyclus]MBS2966878.1 hypothetical protein [Actinocrinis puniceicyclus]
MSSDPDALVREWTPGAEAGDTAAISGSMRDVSDEAGLGLPNPGHSVY